MRKTISIKKNYEFLRIYKNSKFYVGKYLILYAKKNRLGNNRIGITTSKKVGKSVQRNRFRRLIKENYRLYEEFIKSGFDIIFVARSSEMMPGFNEIKKEMKYLLKKVSLFDQEKWDIMKDQKN